MTCSYAPEIVRYHDEPGQHHENHRARLGCEARNEMLAFELNGEVTFTDGSETAQEWSSPLGFPRSPVIGGPEYASRTKNLESRGTATLRIGPQRWFLRPRAQWWGTDFRSEQRINTIPDPGNTYYGNYVDRLDIHGGADVGWSVLPRTYLTLGYRAGRQDQGEVLGGRYEYDNTYQVVLFGIEGAPGDRFRFSVQVGPDYREYEDSVRPGEDRTPVEVYTEAKASASLSAATRVDVLVRSFQFMPSGGEGAMAMRLRVVELHHDAGVLGRWKTGFRLFGGTLDPPDPRGTDQVYTAYASGTWPVGRRVQIGLEFQHDSGRSDEDDVYVTPTGPVAGPNASGREYDRNLIAVSARLGS